MPVSVALELLALSLLCWFLPSHFKTFPRDSGNGLPGLASSPPLPPSSSSSGKWVRVHVISSPLSLIAHWCFVRRTTFTSAPLFCKYILRAHYFSLKSFPVAWLIILSLIAKAKKVSYFHSWHLQAPCTKFLHIFLKAFCIKLLCPFPHFTVLVI